jgi:hypothetical protein
MDHQKIYDSIIKNAKLENRKKIRNKNNPSYFYYEDHHILPKCLGGNNDTSNKILLTAREHFICHKLLTYIYKGNRKIAYAFHRITYCKNGNHIKSSRDYSYAIELIKTTPVSEETKEKMSGKIPWNKGKINVYDKNTLDILSKIKKGKSPKINSINIECEYCHKIFNLGNYYHWHGKKCKMYKAS